ncbi:MAG TPA: RidA family protein [Caulobacteraceae bacterium]|jgi:enamine deaminase RidA (YjgF/YER057c/UK114 family)|nr:RidA family protein [Caulobacteraceae bacterium]
MGKVDYVTRETMKPLLEPFGLTEAARSGGFLHVGGQVGMGPDHQIVAGGLGAQARQAFANLAAVVEAGGGRAENLVSLTWYLVDSGASFMDDALEVTAARNEILPGITPPSTAVRVKALLTPEILIEIQAVAAL